VAAAVRTGERVYDLCCGVGPFALTIARAGRARRVLAIDQNADAIALLRASLTRQPNADRVTVQVGSLEAFLPTAEPVERVVCNLPLEGIKYLASVVRTVAPGGRLHHYEVMARDGRAERVRTMTETLEPAGAWSVAGHHVVHPYSPTSDLVAVELARRA
jgi:tRNA (guanine37-N1)-methyltransferase